MKRVRQRITIVDAQRHTRPPGLALRRRRFQIGPLARERRRHSRRRDVACLPSVDVSRETTTYACYINLTFVSPVGTRELAGFVADGRGRRNRVVLCNGCGTPVSGPSELKIGARCVGALRQHKMGSQESPERAGTPAASTGPGRGWPSRAERGLTSLPRTRMTPYSGTPILKTLEWVDRRRAHLKGRCGDIRGPRVTCFGRAIFRKTASHFSDRTPPNPRRATVRGFGCFKKGQQAAGSGKRVSGRCAGS